MDYDQLASFLEVAKLNSFSRAAEKLYRTQPAVSQAIRKLEDELSEALFDRSSRDGHLTDAGRVLHDYAQKLLNLRGEAAAALVEMREMRKGKLNIAANEYTCLYLLPVLDEFRRRCPMIKVSVQRSLASHISQELINHNAEFGLLSFRPEDRGLRSIVVYRDELAFVVPPGHSLANAREVGIRQLGAESFIAHIVPSPYRAKVLETFRQRKVPLNMNVELPTTEAIKKFVAAGNGVALIPGICVQAEVARGELVHIPVRDLRIERKLRLVYRRGAALSHAARAFLDVAESYAALRGMPYLYQADRA